MIALLDVNNKNILICNKNGINKIPFSNVETIRDILQNKKVYYVTNIVEADGNDIINLVYNIQNIEPPVVSIHKPIEQNKDMFLHCKGEGTLYIDETLKFEGKYDCKLFDNELKQRIENSSLLLRLLKSGKIELISVNLRKQLKIEWKQELNKKKELQKKVDAKLDEIIVSGSAHEVAAGKAYNDDVITLDITNEVKNNDTMTETERILKNFKDIPKE